MTDGAKSANITHGFGNTYIHRVWIDMRRRCHQPQRPDYHRYGGRGISVCERWRSPKGGFEAFLADMGHRPTEKHSLDRRDNDGPYSPENCYWAEKKQQARNTRTNRFVEVAGERITLIEAAERSGINYNTVVNRLNTLGWDIDRALSEPVRSAG